MLPRLLSTLFALLLSSPFAHAEKPNLLLVLADDLTYTDLGVYGGQAKTPNLNALAEEGMQFSNCFQAAPMCSPTRHCLYTGLYPVKSGAYPNHTFAHDWVKSIAHYLQDSGYRTHLSGKTHIKPKSVFPFEYSAKENNPDMDVIDGFVKACTQNDTPFLVVATSNEPHTPWNRGDASAYPPDSLKLPPVFVDTPETRDGYSRYLAEITYYDDQVGQLLEILKSNAVDDNTLVIVLSEQGSSFPFAKWTCYDKGVHSGMIARWPGKIAAKSNSAALVEYVDIVPTFLEAAGIAAPKILDGKSFLPVLTGEKTSHKDFTYSLQTSRGINDGPEQFGIRSVRKGKYRYVRNLTPDIRFQNASTTSREFKSWEAAAEAGNNRAKELTAAYQHRVAEELFDCESDPWNEHNLIANEGLAETLSELRNALDTWMNAQGDEGEATEMAALDRMIRAKKKGKAGKGKSKGKGKKKAK